MNPFLAALRFLTILPAPAPRGDEEEALRRSLAWFPLVGLGIGALVALLAADAAWIFPPAVAAGLVVALLAGASGGLHLDGLADTADGLCSARPRERMLEIMRDSRIGSMGAAALIAVFGLKAAALASLPGPLFWQAALLLPVAGRSALLLSIALWPYARETGLGTLFWSGREPWHALLAIAAPLLCGWLCAGPVGTVAAACALGAACVLGLHCRTKLGGATGDTLGAACEIAELAAALALSAAKG